MLVTDCITGKKINYIHTLLSTYQSNKSQLFMISKAKPKLFGKFLSQVLYPANIRTAIESMAYTFLNDCPFEYFFVLSG